MNNIFFPQLQKMKNLPSTENLNLLFCDVMEQMMLCAVMEQKLLTIMLTRCKDIVITKV